MVRESGKVAICPFFECPSFSWWSQGATGEPHLPLDRVPLDKGILARILSFQGQTMLLYLPQKGSSSGSRFKLPSTFK